MNAQYSFPKGDYVETYQEITSVIALALGASWASGINLYAALLMLGLGGATGHIELPPSLTVLQDPLVIAAAGLMYCVEFFADKIPGVDTGWDAIHTFVRIPAGAVLASGMVGETSIALELAAAIAGGSLAATSHITKASSRVLINTSPEPISNWTASIAEDLAVIAGLWAALNHPTLFIIFLLTFIGLAIYLLPKLWRGARAVFLKIGLWLGLIEDKALMTSPTEASPTEASPTRSSPTETSPKTPTITKPDNQMRLLPKSDGSDK